MSGKYSTDGISNANSAPRAGRDFEQARNDQAYRATQMPQVTQEKVAMLEDIYSKRLQAEQNSQQRSRAFRELKAKTQLLENYVRDDAPRPNDPQARENDLRIIDERSKEMVREREAFYLNRIENERFETVEGVMREEQEKQKEHGAPDHQASHSSELEQER